MIGKLKTNLARSERETLRKQGEGMDVYKASEPMGANALYIVMLDPALPNAEYDLLALLAKTMTEEELRAPEAEAMWKRYIDAFAAGFNKLSLTPVAKSGM
jgi:hypothetical protein